ncbi:TrkA family potassium uptake protein [Citreicella sp. C3M06]|uniref:potassium channel family protein n=1 Tax=Citreicella sp. C3M06 TaxID=2841564 RepID=UPI001C0A4852|nr:TrkA family potassium uptake protein [Citreicella sp. C3M06]MBU2962336.1 TrkA family potassium uptake protein [Citreicella sp. C3M06]
MARPDTKFVVIGLGAFGTTVAQELLRFGNHVMGIDANEKLVSRLADTLTSSAILDSTDEAALREAGVDRYGAALVAIGTNIEASILTTMNLKLLGLKTIWVKAMNRPHHRILSKLGVDRVILPEQEMGRHTAQMLNNPSIQDYMTLGNGYSVVNVVLPERYDGVSAAKLRITAERGLRLLGMMRGTEFIPCEDPERPMKCDDRLVILGKRADLRAFGDAL